MFEKTHKVFISKMKRTLTKSVLTSFGSFLYFLRPALLLYLKGLLFSKSAEESKKNMETAKFTLTYFCFPILKRALKIPLLYRRNKILLYSRAFYEDVIRLNAYHHIGNMVKKDKNSVKPDEALTYFLYDEEYALEKNVQRMVSNHITTMYLRARAPINKLFQKGLEKNDYFLLYDLCVRTFALSMNEEALKNAFSPYLEKSLELVENYNKEK